MSDPSAFLYCPSATWWLSDLEYSNSDVRIPPSLPVCYPSRNSADIPNSTPPFWRSCPHCPTVIERLLKIQFLLAQQPSLSSHNMDPPHKPLNVSFRAKVHMLCSDTTSGWWFQLLCLHYCTKWLGVGQSAVHPDYSRSLEPAKFATTCVSENLQTQTNSPLSNDAPTFMLKCHTHIALNWHPPYSPLSRHWPLVTHLHVSIMCSIHDSWILAMGKSLHRFSWIPLR